MWITILQASPIIILIRPQLVENIGTTARAMMNCCLEQLRIAEPRDAWPLNATQQERMDSASAGAHSILHNAGLYHSTREAVADLNCVYALTARSRDMVKEMLSPREAVTEIHTRIAGGEKIGLMFGPERTGLINDDLVCAEKLISIPANPEFSSFNLAQSVLIMGYEWFTSVQSRLGEAQSSRTKNNKTRPATKDEVFHLFDHLERELEEGGFFTSPDMKPAMTQNLRNAILRAELTEQEVRTWHGMVTALAQGPKKPRRS
ncbi:MAG: RNA methyltransferase [Alphaproteobacteria bacterium]|nr:RNA methyltransferase [Alphaproteobacteria bacterium]